MIKGYILLSVLMALLLYFGQSEAADFYPLINQKNKTNCPYKDNDVNLICQTEGNVSEMIIKRTRDEKVLNKSWGVNSAQYQIEQVQCSDMGEYQCIIDNTRIETTALVISDCSPMPCHGNNTNMTVYADINTSLNISLCVLVYENVNNVTYINNISVRRNRTGNTRWTWDYFENKQTSDCFRNVTIVLKQRKFKKQDYGEMSIRVYSSVSIARFIEYRISLKSPDEVPSSQPTTTDTNTPSVERELHLEDEEDKETRENIATYLPPFLVIAGAVVLTVVMIIRKVKKNKQREAIIPSSNEQINPESTNFVDEWANKPMVRMLYDS